MSYKNLLVSSAIIGTDLSAPALPAGAADLPSELAESLAGLSRASSRLGREGTLLHACAMLCLFEKAGRCLPLFDGKFASPSPPEEKPVVLPAAEAHLKSLLDSHLDLLPEWLQIAGRLKKRIPDDCLTGVLQAACQNKSLQELVAACAGERGRWLARFNPEWGFVDRQLPAAAGTEIGSLQKLFDFGSAEERLAALQEIRRLDPAKGLELVRSSWQSDRPEDRARFLAALETGLSMADEPFLETEALSDRRKEVRFQARERLLKLPESRLSKRGEQRAFACLNPGQAKSGFLSQLLAANKNAAALVVSVPETLSEDMQRDGIVAKSPDSRLGEKAWWLSQIIEQVNPTRLVSHLKMSAVQLLVAFSASEWQLALKQGLAKAVIRNRDCELAMLLLQAEHTENADGLFDLLEAKDQENVLASALAARSYSLHRPGQYDPEMNMLLRMRHPWSSEFSQVILKTLRSHLREKNIYILDYVLRQTALRMDPDLWASVQDTWASSAAEDPALERMMAVLALRKEMRDALFKEA